MSIEGQRPESWTRAALCPPRAHGAPLAAVEFKAEPEDFRVEEVLSFAPAGTGPHWLLQVEKRSANTRWVAAEIARRAGVTVGEVGYAGLKDRHAVALQWFSAPGRTQSADFWSGVRTDEFRVVQVTANIKLKRGALSGNRFRIQLRKVAWPREKLALKLDALRAHGAPNYFGPQRFGRHGGNLDRIVRWTQSGVKPRSRTEREFALSAARALLFNAVLARRVQAEDWSRMEAGDLASLDGSGSHFRVTELDQELRRRLQEFDVHPTGPLWGRGAPDSWGRSLELEREVAREYQAVADLLAAEGLSQERRPLRCAVRELCVEADEHTLTLSFRLGRGQFATAVLREICDFGAQPAFEQEPE